MDVLEAWEIIELHAMGEWEGTEEEVQEALDEVNKIGAEDE